MALAAGSCASAIANASTIASQMRVPLIQGALREAELVLGFAEGRKRAWLFAQEVVVSEEQTEEGFALTVRWSAEQEAAYQRL